MMTNRMQRRGSTGLFHVFAALLRVGILPTVAALAPVSPAAAKPGSPEAGHIVRAGAEAIGGRAWDAGGNLLLQGAVEAGGATGAFRQVIDVATGRSRTDIDMGSLHDVSGYDTLPWTSQNGIVTEIDLPSLVEDARSAALLDAAAWRNAAGLATGAAGGTRAPTSAEADAVRLLPAGGSPVTIWFDRASHLPLRALIETDGGPQTTDYADYRLVGGLQVPFKRTIRDAAGGTTTITLTEAHRSPAVGGVLGRPPVARHGELRAARATRIPFQFTAFDRGHIVVPAKIDGHDVNVIFDSGGANYFTPETARTLGLTTAGGVNIGGVGEGSETGGFARVGSIDIGGARLKDESAIVGPLPYPALRPRKGLETAGLTGYEFLSEFQTTIDYENRTIGFARLGSVRPEGVTVPFRSDGHSIYVAAEVEGASGMFRIDTGDGGTVTVFRRFADEHGLFRNGGRQVVSGGGVGGTLSSVEAVADTFRIAGTTLRSVPVSISDTRSGAFFSRSIAGNIGAGILSRFTVTFDYAARTMTLKPNGSVRSVFPRERTGISVTQSAPDALEVLSVEARSPGATAGLRPGDRIVAVDGRSVAGEGLGAMDLMPLRYGERPFVLTATRSGQTMTFHVVPAPSKRP